jgi:acid stress-induced BolA-like protein IbaG/YrbA
MFACAQCSANAPPLATPTSSVDIRDVSGGCGAQFSLLVVSAAFESVSRVQQQRMVNEALEPHVGNVHSISMATLTPAQWKAKREQHLK